VKEDIALTGEALSDVLTILTDTQQEKAKQVFQRWKKGKERFLGD
jgi:hypothetical protein